MKKILEDLKKYIQPFNQTKDHRASTQSFSFFSSQSEMPFTEANSTMPHSQTACQSTNASSSHAPNNTQTPYLRWHCIDNPSPSHDKLQIFTNKQPLETCTAVAIHNLTSNDITYVTDLLQKCINLSSLRIVNADGAQIAILLESWYMSTNKQVCTQLSHLTKLEITQIPAQVAENAWQSADIKKLQSFLAKTPNLTYLNLAGNYLGKNANVVEELQALAMTIGKYKLIYLNLAHNDLGKNANVVEELATAIYANSRLTSLNLEGNNLGTHPQSMILLLGFISQLSCLTSLNLAGNDLGADANVVEELATAICANSGLTSLNLEGNYLGKNANVVEELQALAITIGKYTLIYLNLAGNYLGNNANVVEVLVTALYANSRLTSLNLAGNYLGKHPQSMILLLQFISQLTKLTSLNLAGNDLGADANVVKELATALYKNPRLISLNLAGNYLGIRLHPSVCVINAIITLIHLTSLNLANNRLGFYSNTTPRIILADNLPQLAQLTDLNLFGNHFNDPQVLNIFKTNQLTHPRLKDLNLEGYTLGKYANENTNQADSHEYNNNHNLMVDMNRLESSKINQT